MMAAAGLRGRRPDWPNETAAQLKRKLGSSNEIQSRETAAVCDMRFYVAGRAFVILALA